jgi:nicotinamide-nucleotide amidase
MIEDQMRSRANAVLEAARARGVMVTTAESCTGGLVSASLTDIAGSSDVFERGFVTYTNAAKQTMLGVPAETIAAHGAVSAETAAAMARGALAHSQAQIAVSITGVAGPGGGSAEKPVGLVHLAAAASNGNALHRERRYGPIGRMAIRQHAVLDALEMLLELALGYERRP